MKKIILFIVVFLISLSSINLVGASNESSYILLDYDSGRVLYGKNIHDRFLTASISKIMTAIVSIEGSNMFDIYKVDNETTLVDGSKIYLVEDDEITVYDLICGLMLRSGNDAATLLANNVFDSYAYFIKNMNMTAKRIGMGNSTFENPTGLNDDTYNYSTAYDMAILMKYALDNEIFYEISTKKIHQAHTKNNHYLWSNKHKLVQSTKYVLSGKTGYTKLCGRTLVSYAEIDNKRMICVTFNEPDDYKFHQTLFLKANQEFEKEIVFDKGVYPQKIETLDYYPLIEDDISLLIKKNSSVYGKFNFNIDGTEECGNIEIYENNKLIYTTNIYPYRPVS